jgi:hypothetical protein
MSDLRTRIANAAWKFAQPKPAPPPPGGFCDDLPEAFAALNSDGSVMVIGYQGEWYEPIRLSLRVRLNNWIVGRINAAECKRWGGRR